MNAASAEPESEDWQFLGWIGVWSLVCLIVIGNLVNTGPLERLSDEGHFVLGFALAGLSSIWVTGGSWAILIHLPSPVDTTQQRVGPRFAVLLIGMIEFAWLGVILIDNALLLAQATLLFLLAITGPIVGWQWTRRRIHRVEMIATNRRNIRQMMGVTFTIAVIAAVLNLYSQRIGISNAAAIVIVSNAFVWIYALAVLLSRWWGFVLLTFPMLFAQWISISSLVDLTGQADERQIHQLLGWIIGFHSFTLLLLTLMRSSHHRWLGSDAPSPRRTN